ncbi:AAA-like domain-containing protein [Nostoc sp. 106C]|uniref:AAA-like domain-containing protein n=1 Tax=Nostoc sp. 106C TaxID=1932667 RepID=UPI000A3CD80A|nr:AAA-like domain-containing protein [Nostoc sp. 106C]OUL30739.1 hypothetical protein BV375_13610 [Nostoc sp. 106C]
MNREQVITKFKELPLKRRMVLEKVLQNDLNEKIMCDLQIADDALSQHLRLLYKDFGITNGMGERSRKRHQLINLIRNAVPDIIELIKEGTLIVLKESSGAEQPPLEEQTTKTSLYVERPPIEQRCYDLIKQPGSLIRIKAPSKMGKTWLMQEILQQAESYNYRQVLLDLSQANEDIFSTADKFLPWFCNSVNSQLQLRNQIDYEWDEKLGSNPNCTNYFEKCLLAQIDHSAFVLGLDNVDRVFPYFQIASPFFSLLRYWYEQARIHKIWSKFRLVIAYSTDVYIPLEIYESPFNVGTEFELRPFENTEVIELVKQHGLALSQTDVIALINLVGGNPRLLNKAIVELKNSPQTTLEDLLKQAHTFSGIYSNHLLNLLEKLKQHTELATAMKKVINGATNSVSVQLEPKQVSQLKRMGLVHIEDNNAKPSCELYRMYFQEHL